MLDVAMHTTIADQTQQMQSAVPVLGSIETLLDRLDLVQLSFLDRLINPHHILPDHATGADIQMPDLGVAHETFWKSDGKEEASSSV